MTTPVNDVSMYQAASLPYQLEPPPYLWVHTRLPPSTDSANTEQFL
jgi:hypothetical protein